MITVAFAAVISLGCANKNTAAPIQTPVAAPQAAPAPTLASHNSWGQEAQLPEGFNVALAGLKDGQAKTVAQWQQPGVAPKGGVANTDLRAWVIVPDDVQGRAFLVYDNFRTIMHWNRSYYFALSIGMMADSISQ